MCYIESTININKSTLKDINFASEKLKISRTKIIIILLKEVMSDKNNKIHICRRIKYQNSDKKKNWHIFHISFKEDEYEYFLDLRKFLKMSLSNIVAYAVKKYLKKLLANKCTDNYPFKNYILAKENAEGVIYWKSFWGVPKNLDKYLTFNDL